MTASNSNNLKTITKLVNTTVKKCSEYQLSVKKREISEFQLRTKFSVSKDSMEQYQKDILDT